MSFTSPPSNALGVGRTSWSQVESRFGAVDFEAVDDLAEGGLEVGEGEVFPVLDEALAGLLDVAAALLLGLVGGEARTSACKLGVEFLLLVGELGAERLHSLDRDVAVGGVGHEL